MITLFLLLGLNCTTPSQQWDVSRYASLWAEVERALKEGKPQTAAGLLETLEQMTAENGDCLERLEVMSRRLESLRRYNWKEYNAYNPLYVAFRDSIYKDLDANIERYAFHPRVDNLINEKIDRLKSEADNVARTDEEKGAEAFLKLREICCEAIKSYPDSKHLSSWKGMVDGMDEKRLYASLDSRCYPGTSMKIELQTANVDKLQMTVFLFSEQGAINSIGKNIADSLYNYGGCMVVGNETIDGFRNRYNIFEEKSIEWTFGREGFYAVVIKDGELFTIKTVNVSRVAAAIRQREGNYELYVTDAKSGMPYDRFSVTSCDWKESGNAIFQKPSVISEESYRQDGFTRLDQKLFRKKMTGANIIVEAVGDPFSQPLNVYNYGKSTFSSNSQTRISDCIYTDRKLYRSDDKIGFKVIRYSMTDRKGEVLAGKRVKISLYPPSEWKAVSEMELVTNEYGSVAGEFALPEEAKHGTWRISTDNGSASFRVEEYKTPDFKLSVDPVETLYGFGDVITRKGHVDGYAGVPMEGAKVEYVVESHPLYGYRGMWGESERIAEGTVTSDAEGCFEVSFRAVRPAVDDDSEDLAIYYNLKVAVTDPKGETHEQASLLLVADIPVNISLELSSGYRNGNLLIVDKDGEKGAKVMVRNHDGVAQKEMKGSFSFNQNGKRVAGGTFVGNEPLNFDFSKLPSGEYEFEYAVEWRGRTIAEKEHLALFSAGDTEAPARQPLIFYPFKNDGAIEFMVGTGESDLYLEIELFDRDKRFYRKGLHLKNQMRRISLPYSEKYDDKVVLSLYAIRNEMEHKVTYTFERQTLPTTFGLEIENLRDYTTPATPQKITIRGERSEALVSIFDVTTDRYGANSFRFSPFPTYRTDSPSISSNLNGTKSPRIGNYYNMKSRTMNEMAFASAPAMSMSMSADVEDYSDDALAVEESCVASGPDEQEVELRSDFGQTLAFVPQLRIGADGKGEVEFETSDAMGTFRVLVLAHDKNLHSGNADATFIVNKELMVMPNIPLFVTEGDEILLKADVINNGSRQIKGVARILAEDADTGEKIELGAKEKRLTLLSGARGQVAWKIKAPACGNLSVTITFAAGGISDGEKHTMIVVPATREVTEAASFVIGDPNGREYYEKLLLEQFGEYKPVLKYEEYSTMDALRTALKRVNEPKGDNMISWLNLLFVSNMREYLYGASAEDAKLSAKAVDKLNSLQKGNGGFSWFPCMDASDLLTALYLEKAWELRSLGILPSAMEKGVKRAVAFIDGRLGAVETGEKWSWNSITDLVSVRMKYTDIPLSEAGAKVVKEYFSRSAQEWQEIGILDKARLAGALLDSKGGPLYDKGFDARVEKLVASLADHAVCNKSVGLYFPNAVMPWRGLMRTEIDAHCQLLELFTRMGDKETARGLQQWLLLQKHNQDWGSDMATARAVYALVGGKAEDLRLGAVYCTYKAPMTTMKETSNEISVKRTYSRNGKLLSDGDKLKVGDRIDVNYHIYNTENRSFVQMRAMRPACFYPVDERSYGGWWFYKEQDATSTTWYFQLLAEEHHDISESFYVSQEGTFNSGIVEIESLYATEYRGHTGAFSVCSGGVR